MFDKRSILALILIIISFVLFVGNLMEHNKGEDTVLGMLSSLLLIIAMVMLLVDKKRKSKE